MPTLGLVQAYGRYSEQLLACIMSIMATLHIGESIPEEHSTQLVLWKEEAEILSTYFKVMGSWLGGSGPGAA